jgi:hypothetical protein
VEKACCEFKVFETDKGFRVVASGELDKFRATMFGCCGWSSDEICCEEATIIKRDCCQVSLKRTDDSLEITYEGDKSLVTNKIKKLLSEGCC